MNWLVLTSLACVLDRTGQSATEQYHRQMALQGAHIANLEVQLDQALARVDHLEQQTRDRGQREVIQIETLEQLRREISRLRGDVEVLDHETQQKRDERFAQSEDVHFRLTWIEARASELEQALGLNTPTPPGYGPDDNQGDTGLANAGDASAEDTGDEGVSTEEDGEPTQDNADLLKLAQDHMEAGRGPAAEAVLKRFIQANPADPRIAEARYLWGETAHQSENYPSAVLRFQEVIDQHHNSEWAAWAMLNQGKCFEAQGQEDNARLFYEDVGRLWPKHPAATEAKERLKQ